MAYLDLTGSGNETAAHLKHDGRMTIMWCSFDADPLILRLYGRGRAVRRQDAEWGELRRHFPALPGERQIIVLEIESVQTSCGYAVPMYTYSGERDTLARWAEKKGRSGLAGLLAREKPGQHRRPAHRFTGGRMMKRILIPLVLLLAACDPSPAAAAANRTPAQPGVRNADSGGGKSPRGAKAR